MKKYQILAMIAVSTVAIVGAQSAAPSAGQPPMPPQQGEQGMYGSMRPEPRDDQDGKPIIRDIRQEMRLPGTGANASGSPRRELMEDRKDMRDQNQGERKDLRMDTREQMKNASSSDERRAIMEDARGKREDMRASNTAERKDMNERSRELAKNKIGQVVERLNMVVDHLTNALNRTERFIGDKKASSTVDMSKYDPMVAKAKASLVVVKANVDAVKSFTASSTDPSSDKEALKTKVKTAQDSVKAFQDDLKNLLETIKIDKSMWDLKSNK